MIEKSKTAERRGERDVEAERGEERQRGRERRAEVSCMWKPRILFFLVLHFLISKMFLMCITQVLKLNSACIRDCTVSSALCAAESSAQGVRLRVHCSDFTLNNYIKPKIVLDGICIVGYSLFNAIWFRLGFLPSIMIAR